MRGDRWRAQPLIQCLNLPSDQALEAVFYAHLTLQVRFPVTCARETDESASARAFQKLFSCATSTCASRPLTIPYSRDADDATVTDSPVDTPW